LIDGRRSGATQRRSLASAFTGVSRDALPGVADHVHGEGELAGAGGLGAARIAHDEGQRRQVRTPAEQGFHKRVGLLGVEMIDLRHLMGGARDTALEDRLLKGQLRRLRRVVDHAQLRLEKRFGRRRQQVRERRLRIDLERETRDLAGIRRRRWLLRAHRAGAVDRRREYPHPQKGHERGC
jgi:hypothetical protein